MNDNDILIALIEHIEQQGNNSYILKFEYVDSLLDLPEGSAKKHIDAAAEKAGFKIEIKGEISARLIPNYPVGVITV